MYIVKKLCKMTSMYARSLKPQKHSFFLLGPRGTGKSTWLNHCLKKAKVINLLDEALYQSYLEDISLFYEALKLLKPHSWVVVDEIQRLPNLLNEVHRLMEERKLKFALTGVQCQKIKKIRSQFIGRTGLSTFYVSFHPQRTEP